MLFSADPVLRRSLEELLRGTPTITIVGVADDPSALLRLIDQNHVDAVLADAPPRELLADCRIRHDHTALVVLVDGGDDENSLDALYAGAVAILPRSAERNEKRPRAIMKLGNREIIQEPSRMATARRWHTEGSS